MFYYEENEELYHYGMPRRSGRYPWGSGDNPYQHSGDFKARVDELKKEGLTEKEIAKQMNILSDSGEPSVTRLRILTTIAKNESRQLKVATAKTLIGDGMSISEVGRKMGINESTVRSLLKESSEVRMNQAKNTAKMLMEAVDKNGIIDVGKGTETGLGISKEKLNEALYICEMEGYPVYGVRQQQVTNATQKTTIKALCPPGTQHKEIYNFKNVHMFNPGEKYHSDDGGITFKKLQYPKSIDSSRVQIRYSEDGGALKDGVIELRRGVEDISLGGSQYAQVRIAVDGTHYMKGMAIYSDNLPDGIDIVYNTNKKVGTPKEEVFKELSNNMDNPFKATIKPVEAGGQRYYIDKNGKEQLSVINKLKDEGDWDKYSDSLSSQFLVKQSKELIKSQLDLSYKEAVDEFDKIKILTNPIVKKNMLEEFANNCDGNSVDLKAAALPRQSWQVILPVTSLKDNEIYAPNYNNGEKVALIRYPHGGTFEIPILTVNNNQKEAKSIIKNAIDAVGINSNVASKLSGADFDGDTVLVIPTNSKTKIVSTKTLEGLEGFEPKNAYPEVEGMRVMTKKNLQNEMGRISNLITDMTLKGANADELARAVRHSMVVIDSEKHKLNYKQSELDNGIASLKKKYQSYYNEDGSEHIGGASTLISRSKSQIRVPETQGSPRINPEDGSVYYKESGRYYTKKLKSGKEIQVPAQKVTTKMATTSDAFTLSSGTIQESYYAEYANKMKALANTARKEMINTKGTTYDANANKVYKEQVESLDRKLKTALLNAPKERQAQRIASVKSMAIKKDNPEMSKREYKKLKQRELDRARIEVGARKIKVDITDKEWEAIQSGAVTNSKLSDILKNADSSRVRELATPKEAKKNISNSTISRIKAMYASGYTMTEIANALSISKSSVSQYVNN